jgi:hypothetical protein
LSDPAPSVQYATKVIIKRGERRRLLLSNKASTLQITLKSL